MAETVAAIHDEQSTCEFNQNENILKSEEQIVLQVNFQLHCPNINVNKGTQADLRITYSLQRLVMVI